MKVSYVGETEHNDLDIIILSRHVRRTIVLWSNRYLPECTTAARFSVMKQFGVGEISDIMGMLVRILRHELLEWYRFLSVLDMLVLFRRMAMWFVGEII